jgi:hypothetical protein
MARRPPKFALEPPPCPDGWRTGPPDFVGVGAQRAGTSWWFRGAIETHPAYQRPGDFPKELHFFDRYWDGDVPHDLAERYARLFPRPEGKFTGEWTPRYMSDFWTLPLLRMAAPDARILVMVRDPLDRYRSAIARESALAAEEQEGGRVPLAVVSDAVWRGFYGEQLSRLLELFPEEQVLVLQYERCRAEPAAELRRTCEFLGIETPAEPSERLLRERGEGTSERRHEVSDLPPEVRDELVERWREDVSLLARLCPDLDLGLWPAFAE